MKLCIPQLKTQQDLTINFMFARHFMCSVKTTGNNRKTNIAMWGEYFRPAFRGCGCGALAAELVGGEGSEFGAAAGGHARVPAME